MIYVGGDGFAAASYAAGKYSFSRQDPRFLLKGLLPHPSNQSKSFPTHISNILHAPVTVNAFENNTCSKIIRQAIEIVNFSTPKYLVLTFPNFFRGEIFYQGNWHQFTFNDDPSINEELNELQNNQKYSFTLETAIAEFNNSIKDLTNKLNTMDINYCFVMSTTFDAKIDNVTANWLFDPQKQSIQSWAESSGYLNQFGYLDAAGHLELTKLLIPYLTN